MNPAEYAARVRQLRDEDAKLMILELCLTANDLNYLQRTARERGHTVDQALREGLRLYVTTNHAPD